MVDVFVLLLVVCLSRTRSQELSRDVIAEEVIAGGRLGESVREASRRWCIARNLVATAEGRDCDAAVATEIFGDEDWQSVARGRFLAKKNQAGLRAWQLARGSSFELDLFAARGLMQTGSSADALALARNASQAVDPEIKSQAWLLIAELFGEQGAEREVMKALATAVEVAPKSAQAWRQHGLMHLDFLRDTQKGHESLRRALDLDPNDLGARHGLERAERYSDQDFLLVTFASDQAHCGLRRLLESAHFFGISRHQIHVLGLDQKDWSNGQKLKLLLDFAVSVAANTWLCVVDGYDLVIADTFDLNKLLRFFPSSDFLGDDLVLFSADQTFYFVGPDESCYAHKYPPGHQPFRFLNSGSFFGRAEVIANLVSSALLHFSPKDWDQISDQTLLHRIYVEQYYARKYNRPSPCFSLYLDNWTTALASTPTIVLDHSQLLFGNTGGRAFLQDFRVLDGRIHNKVTDTFPVVIHIPGGRRFESEFYRLAKEGSWRLPLRDCPFP